jgi:hypothetical protein
MPAETKRLITAPIWWGNILEQFPIVAITGANYYPAPHGAVSSHLPLWDYKGMLLESDLKSGRWPTWDEMQRGYWPDKSRQLFAIGALIYFMTGQVDDKPFYPRKYFAKHLCYEMENRLVDLVQRDVLSPQAWVMADFDCVNTLDNSTRIVNVFSKYYSNENWSLFDSGGSFHWVLEQPIPPRNLPWHLGRLVGAFAETALADRRHIFAGISKDLQKYFQNPLAIISLSQDILATISHYDEAGQNRGIPFIIDLRHLAHSLLEWVRFQETHEGSCGFLRISHKWPDYKTPPYLIARNRLRRGIRNFASPGGLALQYPLPL